MPDGKRLIRKAFVFLPRGNWKTSWDAGLALKCLLADGRSGQVIVSAAKDREQAGLMYRYCSQYVRGDPELSEIAECIDSAKRIVVPATGSYFVSIPADHKGTFGMHPSVVLFDEYHVGSRELSDVLATSQGTISEPLTIFTTSAGTDPRHSIAGQEYSYACKVRDGAVIDPHYLPLIFEAAAGDAWDDPATWRRANPVWDYAGETFHKYIADQATRAKEQPAFLPSFLTYHLNRWGETLANRFIDLNAWDATAGMVVEEDLEGRDCFAGLDLSSTTDLTALSLVFPMAPTATSANAITYQTVMRFWMPEENLERRSREDQVNYRAWVDEGFLTLTPGHAIEYSYIESEILQLAQRFSLKLLAFDRWGATMLSQRLQDEGITVVPFGQGYKSMSPACKELLRLVLAKRLVHGGHPVLRWCIANAVAETDEAENVKLTKSKSTGRIDGAVALAMALDRATRQSANDAPLISWVG